MKNILYYFYQITVGQIHRINDNYWFEINGFPYFFTPLTVSYDEINTIYSLLMDNQSKNLSLFHTIIVNKMNQIVTSFEQKNYVLLKLSLPLNQLNLTPSIYDLSLNQYVQIEKKYYSITRDYWKNLWEKKIDYFESEVFQIDYKFPLLLESAAYYIGLGENAISYLNYVIMTAKKDNRDYLVVSHRTCHSFSSLLEYKNPMNIVLDHYVRDIADYLKYVFWNDIYHLEEIKQFLNQLNLSDYGAGLLVSRLLFPSTYFDLCFDIFANYQKEEKISSFIARTSEFESFFKDIFDILRKKNSLKDIDWITNPHINRN